MLPRILCVLTIVAGTVLGVPIGSLRRTEDESNDLMANSQNQHKTAAKPQLAHVEDASSQLVMDDAENRWEGDGGYVWMSPESVAAKPDPSN